MFDADIDRNGSSFAFINFFNRTTSPNPVRTAWWADGDAGQTSEDPGTFSTGTWYHCLLQWNPHTLELSSAVTERDTSQPVGQTSETLSNSFVGIDRLAVTTASDDEDPGDIGVSYVDNVVVSVESTIIPAPTVLGAGGGLLLVLLGRRRRSAA